MVSGKTITTSAPYTYWTRILGGNIVVAVVVAEDVVLAVVVAEDMMVAGGDLEGQELWVSIAPTIPVSRE